MATARMDLDQNQLPEGEEKSRAVREMFDRIAPRYDLVNRVMTFRLDKRWRKTTIQAMALPTNSLVLDLACGTGDFCNNLTDRGMFPMGIDFSLGMMKAATTQSPLVQADVLELPVQSQSVDGITCGFALRNLVELTLFFDEIARVLRPGGRIGLLDVAQPNNRILRWGHNLYFGRIVPVVGRILSERSAYSYLPKSVSYLPEIEVMVNDLKNSGFQDITHKLLAPGSVQLITATKST